MLLSSGSKWLKGGGWLEGRAAALSERREGNDERRVPHKRGRPCEGPDPERSRPFLAGPVPRISFN